MSGIISGNMVGGASPLRTLILEDSDGVQLTGVVVGSEVIFTADASTDIREGKVAATDSGVVTGSAIIPNYQTYEGTKIITNGAPVVLSIENNYDYTKLQAIICTFSTSLKNSVAAEKVAIENNVHEVLSTEVVSSIAIDEENHLINFGITNTSGNMQVIRYILYKELY